MPHRMDRRQFLKTGALAGTSFMVLESGILGQHRLGQPSDVFAFVVRRDDDERALRARLVLGTLGRQVRGNRRINGRCRPSHRCS